MLLINQPFNGHLGDILKDKLQESFNRFTIVSAFAKNSGVLRLKPALEQFKAKNGYIVAFIGVDAHGTSYEAVINLFKLCDAVYIVHSERSTTTFHSKMYMLEGDSGKKWLAVGSNNLTGGGLWSNFESATCFDSDDQNTDCFKDFDLLIKKYRDEKYTCSLLIQSQEDIDELLAADYLRKEVSLRIDASKANDTRHKKPQLKKFGNQDDIYIPQIDRQAKGTIAREHKEQVQDENVQAMHPIEPSDNTELMWFETRSLTGGSRNILDLSKLGTILSGGAAETRYETNNPNCVLGGVVFFDMDPGKTSIEKSITVNYNGIDYNDCVIKFPSGKLSNGSWRIQLKGQSKFGDKIHMVGGKEWLMHKIIVFEKISSNYYVMSVLDENQLSVLANQSIFVASNGSAADSKQYGLL